MIFRAHRHQKSGPTSLKIRVPRRWHNTLARHCKLRRPVSVRASLINPSWSADASLVEDAKLFPVLYRQSRNRLDITPVVYGSGSRVNHVPVKSNLYSGNVRPQPATSV